MRAPLLILVLAASLACAGPARAQASPSSETPRPEAAARAAELLATAETTREVGGPDQAMAALVTYEQAAAWAAQGRAPATYARARRGKALSLQALGRPGEALEALSEAVATARSARLSQLLVELLDRQAAISEEMGLVSEAIRAVREAALVRDELGLVEEAINGFLHLAELELSRDGGRAAAPALQAALERARRAELPRAMRAALEGQIDLALAMGDAGAARRAAEELLGVSSDSPDGGGAGSSLVLLGRTLAAAGDGDAALPILEDAATACAESGDAACESDAREVLTATLLELDRPREAVQQVLGLVAARRSLGDVAGELRAHLGLARAFSQLGRLEPALSSLTEAERLAEDTAPTAVRAALQVERARLLTRTRRVLEAADAWDEALELSSTDDDGRPWPDAPTRLLALPSRESLQREQLDTLVEAGLWARALSACSSCTDEGDREPVSLETLRELTFTQQATLVTWRALDDSLLSWALTTDGRLFGARIEGLGSRDLSSLADEIRALAPRVEVPKPGTVATVEGEDLRRALRRLHDALLGPLESALPDAGQPLLLRAPPQLTRLPWGLLLDDEDDWLGARHGLAELDGLADLPRRPGSGLLRIVADLREPEFPGMDVRRLVARLDGEARRKAEAEEAARAAAAEPPPKATRSRRAPGRRRTTEAPAERPPAPQPLTGERRYERGLVVLAGAAWVPERLEEIAGDAAVLILLVDCEEFEPPGMDGALVALPSCHGAPAEAAARRLLAAGARAVLLLRWDPGPAAREALTAGLVAATEGGMRPARALAGAADSGLPSTAWGSLRLVGAAR